MPIGFKCIDLHGHVCLSIQITLHQEACLSSHVRLENFMAKTCSFFQASDNVIFFLSNNNKSNYSKFDIEVVIIYFLLDFIVSTVNLLCTLLDPLSLWILPSMN